MGSKGEGKERGEEGKVRGKSKRGEAWGRCWGGGGEREEGEWAPGIAYNGLQLTKMLHTMLRTFR